MAYFDSPKNRAMWNKELKQLREEKERRAAGIMPEPAEDMTEKGMSAQKSKGLEAEKDHRRRKINLQELEEIEARMSGVRRVKRPTRQRVARREMDGPHMDRNKEKRVPVAGKTK